MAICSRLVDNVRMQGHTDEIEAIDYTKVDWDRVRHSEYLVHQRFCYEYPAPIHDLRHQLMVVPPTTFGDQLRTIYSLEVSKPGKVITRMDAFSNTVIDVRIPLVEGAIEFESWVTLERTGPARPRVLPASWLHDPRLLTPTERTRPDAAIEEVALTLSRSGLQGLALAELANTWVYETMVYTPGATSVHTTAADAISTRRGVCQDYSHLMLALCRRLGLPTLYVSGHLLGEGGTHAWVEVVLPATDDLDVANGWALDPTHGCRANLSYLTVAVGRDYGDVAPTSGSYRAGHGGELQASKEVHLIGLTYEPTIGTS